MKGKGRRQWGRRKFFRRKVGKKKNSKNSVNSKSQSQSQSQSQSHQTKQCLFKLRQTQWIQTAILKIFYSFHSSFLQTFSFFNFILHSIHTHILIYLSLLFLFFSSIFFTKYVRNLVFLVGFFSNLYYLSLFRFCSTFALFCTALYGRMRNMGSSTSSRGIAAIVGVGPKLGRSIARKFAHEGYTVAILARDLGIYLLY